MTDDFNWDDVDTIVPAQGAIAVYENPHGNVVVREQVPYPEDDKWIVFLPQYAEAIVRRIIEVAGLPFTLVPNGSSAVGSSDKTKDCTAAERQRRRRNKLRKARDSNRDDFDTSRESRRPSRRLPLIVPNSCWCALLPSKARKRSEQRRSRADRTAVFGRPRAPRLRVCSVAPAAIKVLRPAVARIATSRDRP